MSIPVPAIPPGPDLQTGTTVDREALAWLEQRASATSRSVPYTLRALLVAARHDARFAGPPPPEPKVETVPFTVRLDGDAAEWLGRKAAEDNRTRSYVLRWVLRVYRELEPIGEPVATGEPAARSA